MAALLVSKKVPACREAKGPRWRKLLKAKSRIFLWKNKNQILVQGTAGYDSYSVKVVTLILRALLVLSCEFCIFLVAAAKCS
jgi:hypothetical protein